MGDDKAARDLDREWKKRVLCSDESCIGTIGSDGRCRECGLPFEGALPEGFDDAQGSGDPPPSSDEAAPSESVEAESAADPEQDAAVDPDDEWARRTLCRDESCIGVIDHQTGRCKECGKPLHEE